MRVLLVHQNFPGQFKHLAPALVARGDEVTAFCMETVPPMAGVRIERSQGRCATGAGHPWARDFDTKVIRGEATLQTARRLKREGYAPDVIFAHPGWGEPMFLKEVWPEAKLALYCEFTYHVEGGDADFDPEFPLPRDATEARSQTFLRNLPQRMLFDLAEAGLSPTRFQASTYPEPFRDRISVIHDGIDTDALASIVPQPMQFASGVKLMPGDEIVTFVSRNLEPYRGYHRFMRALPELLRRRPEARVVIVGGNGVSYGAAPPKGTTWKQRFFDEVAADLDRSRVHFLGKVPYSAYLNLLRLSKLHVYLTYPFVASWSLLEAMAIGAPILASDTAPVTEFVADGGTGLTFDFLDTAALVDGACRLLEDRELAVRLAGDARTLVARHYDLRTVCLPRQLAWLDSVAEGRGGR